MNVTVFILCLFLVELAAEMGIQLKSLIAEGFSLKNILLYFLILVALVRMAFAGDFNRITKLKGIIIPFVLLILYAAISFLSNYFLGALPPSYSLYTGIAFVKNELFDVFLFFILYAYFAKSEKNAEWLFRTFFFIIVAGSVITILGTVIQPLNFFGFNDESIRPNGPFGEPNQSGAVFAFFIPVMLSQVFTDKTIPKKLYYFAGVTIVMIALLATSSRGGLLAAFFGTGFLFWLLRKQIPARHFVIIALILPFICILAWLILPSEYKALMIERFGFVGEKQINYYDASAGRTYVWGLGIKSWLKSPVIGFGWGSFRFLARHSSHNSYLEILVGVGLVGLSLYLSILVGYIRRVVRSLKKQSKDERVKLCGFLAGFSGLMVAIFFVNLYKPWLFIWAFLGVSVSYCNILSSNKKQKVAS